MIRKISDLFEDNFFDTYELSKFKFPATNIEENQKEYIVSLAVPGFDKKDFNINMEDNYLIISAIKEVESDSKNKNYTKKEFSSTSFRKEFTLPNYLKKDNITAKYSNGILKIIIPKEENSNKKNTKKIEID